MSELNHHQYYIRRETQERELAARAMSREIQAVHLELADRYSALREETEDLSVIR